MADNINVTPGTGSTIAADDIGGVLHQRVKISQGADGSATDVSSTDPLNVTLANTGANATAVKVDNSAVTQPVSGTVTANAGTGSFTVTQSTASNLKVDLSGTAANSTAIKVDGSAVTQPTSQVAGTTGGYTPYFIDAVTTTATVSGSAGKLSGFSVMNTNSTVAWLQVFDTTGAVTLGTTTPTASFPIPANSTAGNGAGSNFISTVGMAIANGIKIAFTTTAKGATTVSTGVSGTILYK